MEYGVWSVKNDGTDKKFRLTRSLEDERDGGKKSAHYRYRIERGSRWGSVCVVCGSAEVVEGR